MGFCVVWIVGDDYVVFSEVVGIVLFDIFLDC